ncbi:hypothetical protein GWK08_01230 [Leptobacterium flavescens]|uniref:Uncharacterized protein n=1 Tax=Leptobacterium flavescens TaxID=472055 RepID=A0A6P0UHX4_9FLAO|nr:hypothetical protein [Leptobacterium flavescens]NER12050.1 hypothetical protein [Leptobacterium flavescens]
MSSTVFKRLFEIRFLHDYFLTTADGTSFFDRNLAEKKDLINKKLSHNIYDIKDLFDINPLEDTKRKMSEYRLLMARTALGFIVGTEVDTENVAGEIRYKAVQEFIPELSLGFSVRPKLPFFNSMTNINLRHSLPSIYYLTNKNKTELDEAGPPPYKSLPLSNNVEEHQPGKTYEMGSYVNFGGTIREALQQTDGSDPTYWEDTTDKRFLNASDRILLPSNFIYRLKKEQNITQIKFVLEDVSNTEIKTIDKGGLVALGDIPLNFEKVDETDENSPPIPSDFYTLKITANAGPEVSYPVYLNSEIYHKDHFALIDIRFDETGSPYSLLDAGGFLITKIDGANQKVSHPVFEIRLSNRRTYWRYRKEGGFSAPEIAATAAHLSLQSEKLISIKPKAITEALVPFKNGTALLLPHPRIPAIRVEEEKIFSEIYINQSNRLLKN